MSLEGAHILITRTKEDSLELADKITALSGRVTCVPMIEIVECSDSSALCKARRDIGDFDWIALSSRHGATALLEKLPVPKNRPKIAAVGDSTAIAIRNSGWPLDFVSSAPGVGALAQALKSIYQMEGSKILYPCSNLARQDFVQSMKNVGAKVTMVLAYQTVTPNYLDLPHFNIAVFASPSAVQNYCLKNSSTLKKISAVSMGPTTSKALKELGANKIIQASSQTNEALLEAINLAWKKKGE